MTDYPIKKPKECPVCGGNGGVLLLDAPPGEPLRSIEPAPCPLCGSAKAAEWKVT